MGCISFVDSENQIGFWHHFCVFLKIVVKTVTDGCHQIGGLIRFGNNQFCLEKTDPSMSLEVFFCSFTISCGMLKSNDHAVKNNCNGLLQNAPHHEKTSHHKNALHCENAMSVLLKHNTQ